MPTNKEAFHSVPAVDYPGKGVTLIRKGSKAGQKFADETLENEKRNQFSGYGAKTERKVAKAMAANTVAQDLRKEESDRQWARHKRNPDSPYSLSRYK